jgi:uncharacterized protein (TIGR02678 family)
VLLALGVLRRVAGDETGYVHGPGDALYDVDRRVLSGMLVTRRGPSTVDETGTDARLASVGDELVADTDEARTRAVRHRLTRRLLDDPVVYYFELAYLSSQRAAVLRRIREATGLVEEVRAEGIALVDPAGRDALSDVTMPEEGTDGHVTLLVAEHLAAFDGAPVPLTDLERHVAALAVEHRTHWRQGSAEPAGVTQLTARAIDRLAALRLARRGDDGVLALPALARFRVAAAAVPEEALT